MPAWAVSLLVHVVILSLLGAATFSREVQTAVASINSALVSTEGEPDELIMIDAPPSDAPRDQAVGDPDATAGPGSGLGGGIGTGPPSATPRVGVASAIGEKTSLPSVQVVPHVSGLSDAARRGLDRPGRRRQARRRRHLRDRATSASRSTSSPARSSGTSPSTS